jgi:hypothetical protein
MRDLNEDEIALALLLADVALPAHAMDCEPWEWHCDAWRRMFTVREWRVAALSVAVSGEQTHHGDVRHWMYVGGEEQLTRADRLSLKTALSEADELLESLDSFVN